MDNSAKEETIQLEINDFGPVAKAKIDLRPLTVFVGPNNSGKSYLAILIYALHRCFSSLGIISGGTFGCSAIDRQGRKKRIAFDNDLGELLKETHSNLNRQIELKKGAFVLPSRIATLIRDRFGENADFITGEIKRGFRVSNTDALNRRGGKNHPRINIRWTNSHDSKSFEHSLTLAKKIKSKTTVPDVLSFSNDFRYDNRFERNMMQYSHYNFCNQMFPKDNVEYRRFGIQKELQQLMSTVLPYVVGPWCQPAYFLPSNRTGLMHARNVIISSLISNASMPRVCSTVGTATLSGVMTDFLGQLLNLDHNNKCEIQKHDLGEMIEKQILHGAIKIIRAPLLGYPYFVYRPNGRNKDIKLANASSMVAELAPLVLYLRHLVELNNVLIIEEPESHLHPAMQVEFIRQLAKIVDKGIRVIVTTHSEWLLDELANIVRRSRLPVSKRDNKTTLNPEHVGVWLFNPKLRPKGSIVNEVHLNECGLYPTQFEDVARTLHNDWVGIADYVENNQ